jgi:multidrug efflux pump subunit AcrB
VPAASSCDDDLGAAFFAGSIALIPLLPTGFIPPDDNSQTQVYLELPPGSTLAQTRRSAESARLLIATVDHVRSVYTTIGGGSAGDRSVRASRASEVRKATLTVQLAERTERPRKQGSRSRSAPRSAIARRAQQGRPGRLGREVHPGADRRRSAGAGQAARAVENDLRTIPGSRQHRLDASLVRPEIAVRPDFAAPPTWA